MVIRTVKFYCSRSIGYCEFLGGKRALLRFSDITVTGRDISVLLLFTLLYKFSHEDVDSCKMKAFSIDTESTYSNLTLVVCSKFLVHTMLSQWTHQ